MPCGSRTRRRPPAAAPPAAPETPEHTLHRQGSRLYSEYEYRGISQTSEKPAVQLNLDYAHTSGFYLGTFLSNIKWLKDTAEVNGFTTSADVEWDIYGGYKFEVVKDWTLDVGYLRYEYPSSSDFNPEAQHRRGVHRRFLRARVARKYSYSINDTFGVPNSKGSDYIEIDCNQPITLISDKLTFNGVARPPDATTHNGDLSYTVWKLGAHVGLRQRLERRRLREGHRREARPLHRQGQGLEQDRLVGFVTYSF